MFSPDIAYRPLGPRCLPRRCQRKSPGTTSNIVGLKLGWTGHRLRWTDKRFWWTGDNPDDACFRRGGGSARKKHFGQQVSRAASKRFLTEDEARHEQWKAIQAIRPRSTWAPHDEERSTEFLVDDGSPLVQPSLHAVAEGQSEPGLQLFACPLIQEEIDLLQQTKGVVSAVTRSATRERARPLRNSTRAARDTRRGTAENTISRANSSETKEKYEIASNFIATEMCDENDEGLDNAAAIAYCNLLCEKRPIDWCAARSRYPTARLVISYFGRKLSGKTCQSTSSRTETPTPTKYGVCSASVN